MRNNYFEKINNNLRKYQTFENDEFELFNSLLEYREVSKKVILYESGEVHDSLSYVLQGAFKAYIVNEKGNEIVFHFPIEDWWVCDINSFYFGEPATIQFETIEDCKLLSINASNMAMLKEKNHKFEIAFNNLLKRYIVSIQKKYFDLLSLTANERYNVFINQYPSLVQRVPLKSIASYLGITPEFLSKMRAKK